MAVFKTAALNHSATHPHTTGYRPDHHASSVDLRALRACIVPHRHDQVQPGPAESDDAHRRSPHRLPAGERCLRARGGRAGRTPAQNHIGQGLESDFGAPRRRPGLTGTDASRARRNPSRGMLSSASKARRSAVTIRWTVCRSSAKCKEASCWWPEACASLLPTWFGPVQILAAPAIPPRRLNRYPCRPARPRASIQG